GAPVLVVLVRPALHPVLQGQGQFPDRDLSQPLGRGLLVAPRVRQPGRGAGRGAALPALVPHEVSAARAGRPDPGPDAAGGRAPATDPVPLPPDPPRPPAPAGRARPPPPPRF